MISASICSRPAVGCGRQRTLYRGRRRAEMGERCRARSKALGEMSTDRAGCKLTRCRCAFELQSTHTAEPWRNAPRLDEPPLPSTTRSTTTSRIQAMPRSRPLQIRPHPSLSPTASQTMMRSRCGQRTAHGSPIIELGRETSDWLTPLPVRYDCSGCGWCLLELCSALC